MSAGPPVRAYSTKGRDMNKLVCRWLLLLFLLANLSACRKQEPWKPVVEPGGFDYLADAVAEALDAHRALADHLEKGDREHTLQALAQSRHSLLKLQRYYIPMTEVRQMVYDADRLYFLRRVEESGASLEKAKTLLQGIARTDGPGLEKEANQVETKIDALLAAMQQASPEVSELFGSLGHRVNLMVLKGDMVLAGARFSEER